MSQISTTTDAIIAVNGYQRLEYTKENLSQASRTLENRNAPNSEILAEIAKIEKEMEGKAAEIRSLPADLLRETREELKKDWHRNEADRNTLQCLNRISPQYS